MSKAKKIFLLNERRETWRIRAASRARGYCPRCDDEVLWLTSRDSMEVLSMNERDVMRLTEDDAIHFREDARGRLLICNRSLDKLK